MKNILTIILIAFALNISAQNYIEHKVKSGETIESIAKSYLVTPFDIFALNPDAKSRFQVNTVLLIPKSKVKNDPIAERSKELIGYKNHKVKRKETLYGLSKKYNVTEEDIKKANRFLYAENLKKGDKIRIPKYKTIVSKKSYKNTLKKYTVQPKEGKWRIAYKFGITVDELKSLNPNIKEVLQPGDELNVPNIKDADEKPIESNYNYYEVLPKEGFYRLEVKTGLTQQQLETLNPELKTTGLQPGMVLKLPDTIVGTNELPSKVTTTDLKLGLNNFETKRIALMMPYQLHKIDIGDVEGTKDMIKDKKLLSIVLDFHVGVSMALDSAKQLGISTHLKVLDTRYQASTTRQLLETHDLSNYDAVIGPMQPEAFDRVAKHLKSDKVPVIAALNMPKEVYSNVFQTVPDDKLLQQTMIDFVKKDSLKSKVIIIADQSHRSISATLKTEFPGATQIYSEKDKKTGKDEYFVYPVRLENLFSKGKTVVFLETNNDTFVSSITSMINGYNKDDVEIVLVTTNYNNAFEGKDIDNNYLSNLTFHYPSVNKTFDESKSNGFVRAYQKQYGVSPSKYAARGFDITLDILMRLATEDNLYEASTDTIETEYIENKFRYKKALFGGYNNDAVYIVKFNNLRIVGAN
ncbi:LysM peptidoglycan-binding domain-containing protein [uncultured Winogradskyella sp.]|uniref:PBP1 and LysM peptidoglycan-binding domain-containing protein n=1 Tax=uncultured Winogradskyella sp. TaxID=395353 RepID=UPI00261083FE|nr:LysM peptidoglycan-binding domain-containing protein [uncultured Winogradskyella sp.]